MKRTFFARGGLLLLLAALTLPASEAAADDGPDCRLTTLASLPLDSHDPDKLLVPATLNGRAMALSVSTGSPGSALSQSTVDALGLETMAMGFRHKGLPENRETGLWMGREYVDLNGRTVDRMATVSEFDLGDIRGRNLEFSVWPENRGLRDVAGAIGADILARYDVEIDFAAGRMNLISPRHCPGKVIYWTKSPYASARFHLDRGGHILIPAEIDGVSLDATLATGVSATLMKKATAQRLFGWDRDPPELVADGPRYFRYPFHTLRFAGATVQNPTVRLADDIHEKWDLVLGLSALKPFHVYIAYDEQTIYLTAADAH